MIYYNLGEEGQDAGGLLREWYLIISREIFNPMYALWSTSQGDRVTYTPNPASYCNSNHLSYFKVCPAESVCTHRLFRHIHV